MHPHFYIICSCRNAEKWIEKCINSVKDQEIKDFTFLLWLDNPTDSTVEIAALNTINDSRFVLFDSKEQVYASKARWNLLQSIEGAKPTDVVVLLDGDDWLYSNESLSSLAKTYQENEVVATHGNFISTKNTICSWSRDYEPEVKIKNTFRESPWIATHLRTFKYGLLTHLNEEILKDPSGNFYQSATDLALYLPILELSGIHSMYVNEVLYVYNDRDNAIFVRERMENQKKNENEIRQKPKLQPLHKDIIYKMIKR